MDKTPVKKRKKALLTTVSEPRDKKKQRTPDDLEPRKLDFEEPLAIYTLLNYSKKNALKLKPEMQQVFRYIVTTTTIPDDFEENHKYGPKSGISFEERLIFAYAQKHFDTYDTKLRKFILSRRWSKAAEHTHTLLSASMNP